MFSQRGQQAVTMIGSGDEYETCNETLNGASPITPPTLTREQIFPAPLIALSDQGLGVDAQRNVG